MINYYSKITGEKIDLRNYRNNPINKEYIFSISNKLNEHADAIIIYTSGKRVTNTEMRLIQNIKTVAHSSIKFLYNNNHTADAIKSLLYKTNTNKCSSQTTHNPLT